MKKLNLSSRTTELNLRKRELKSQLSELRKELVYKEGSARKKRNYFKRHKEITEELTQIEGKINEEKERFLVQKQRQESEMFRTPPDFAGASSHPQQEGEDKR